MLDKATLLSYLLNKTPRASWAKCDEPVYISFDVNSFAAMYKHIPFVQALLHVHKPISFSPFYIRKIKNKLIEEWSDRAKVKMEFFSSDKLPDYENKNVYFIFASGALPLHESGLTIGLHENDASGKDISNVFPQVKVTLLQKVTPQNMTELFSYHVLHEAGHALRGMKHFRSSEFSASPPPFLPSNSKELNCQNTIMAYEQDCPPYLEAVHDLLTSKGKVILRNTTDVSEQEILRKINNVQPSTLGEYDIAAAALYQQECALKINKPPYKTSTRKNAPKGELIITSPQLGSSEVNPFVKHINLFFTHSGHAFAQSFCSTIIDKYIQPLLINLDFKRQMITVICTLLKTSVDSMIYGVGISFFNQFISHVLPLCLRQCGVSEKYITDISEIFSTTLTTISLSFREIVILENLLTQVVSAKTLTTISLSFREAVIRENLLTQVVSANIGREAGKKLAQIMIQQLPKLKNEDLPQHHFVKTLKA